MGAQGIFAGTGELVCKAQHKTVGSEPAASNHPTAHNRGKATGADPGNRGGATGTDPGCVMGKKHHTFAFPRSGSGGRDSHCQPGTRQTAKEGLSLRLWGPFLT